MAGLGVGATRLGCHGGEEAAERAASPLLDAFSRDAAAVHNHNQLPLVNFEARLLCTIAIDKTRERYLVRVFVSISISPNVYHTDIYIYLVLLSLFLSSLSISYIICLVGLGGAPWAAYSAS